RSQFGLGARYSGVNVAAVSPACSTDRHRVLTCGAAAAPFITTVSFTCHRPGRMPSAIAGDTAAAQTKAMARILGEASNRYFVIIERAYRALTHKASRPAGAERTAGCWLECCSPIPGRPGYRVPIDGHWHFTAAPDAPRSS